VRIIPFSEGALFSRSFVLQKLYSLVLLSHISLGDNGEQRFVFSPTVERFDGILRCDSTVMPGTTSSHTLLEFGDSALSMHFEDTEGRAAFTMYVQLLQSFSSNN
jgi:hypothetical protein